MWASKEKLFGTFPPHGSASLSHLGTQLYNVFSSFALPERAAAAPWPAASSRGLLASAGLPESSSASARRLPGSLPSAAVVRVLVPPAPAAATWASYCSTHGLLSPWDHQTISPQTTMQPEAVHSQQGL